MEGFSLQGSQAGANEELDGELADATFVLVTLTSIAADAKGRKGKDGKADKSGKGPSGAVSLF